MSGSTREHWDRVYRRKAPTETSWYEPAPDRSLALIEATGVARRAPIVDVGGGASTLVDHLLDAGYSNVTVLDVAASALAHAQARLGERAETVTWIAADIRTFRPERRFALWHDRAALHFLTDPADRARYMKVLRGALAPGGHVVIATFGPGGPTRCSGLDVHRYGVDTLGALLGQEFAVRAHAIEVHTTPAGLQQEFLYAWWQAEG